MISRPGPKSSGFRTLCTVSGSGLPASLQTRIRHSTYRQPCCFTRCAGSAPPASAKICHVSIDLTCLQKAASSIQMLYAATRRYSPYKVAEVVLHAHCLTSWSKLLLVLLAGSKTVSEAPRYGVQQAHRGFVRVEMHTLDANNKSRNDIAKPRRRTLQHNCLTHPDNQPQRQADR